MMNEKLNGWRFASHYGRSLERVYMTGRSVSKVTGLYSERGAHAPCLWPTNTDIGYTVLDGEVMPPYGATFHDMASIMNSDPETAEESIKLLGKPSYHVFDILFYDGRDVRELAFEDRHYILCNAVMRARNELITVVPLVKPSREEFRRIVDAGG